MQRKQKTVFHVDRFGLLATTVKNAKNLVTQGLFGQYILLLTSIPALIKQLLTADMFGQNVILISYGILIYIRISF